MHLSRARFKSVAPKTGVDGLRLCPGHRETAESPGSRKDRSTGAGLLQRETDRAISPGGQVYVVLRFGLVAERLMRAW